MTAYWSHYQYISDSSTAGERSSQIAAVGVEVETIALVTMLRHHLHCFWSLCQGAGVREGGPHEGGITHDGAARFRIPRVLADHVSCSGKTSVRCSAMCI